MRPWLVWFLAGESVLVATLLVVADRLPAGVLRERGLLLLTVGWILLNTPCILYAPKVQLKWRSLMLWLLVVEGLLTATVAIVAYIVPFDSLLASGFGLRLDLALIVLTPIPAYVLMTSVSDIAGRAVKRVDTLEEAIDLWFDLSGPALESKGELEALHRLKRAGLLARLATHIRDSTACVARRFKLPRPPGQPGSGGGGSIDRLLTLKRFGSLGPGSLEEEHLNRNRRQS